MRSPLLAHGLRVVAGVGLLVALASCRSTPLDNIWPGCCDPAPVATTPVRVVAPTPLAAAWTVEVDERISPAVDCNPIRTQHLLVVTVRDQCGNPLPGQRVEWILSRYPEAVGDIVAVDDQWGVGAIAPMTDVGMGNNGNKIDNHYAVSVTNYGPEFLDAGNNHPFQSPDGQRFPDITVGPGQSWIVITSTREGVTDLVVFVPAIRDGTKHKAWAKKIWADFDVRFPADAVNTLPADLHGFPVQVVRSDGSPIPGQSVEAEILDGPEAVFETSNGRTAALTTDATGTAEFRLRNTGGQPGVNRVRLTANGNFYGEVCPRSRIVQKRWQRVQLEVACAYPGGGTAVAGVPFDKTITVTNTGDAPASGVILEDRPDPGLTFADGYPGSEDLGVLAPGQTVTRTVRLIANDEGTFQNHVSVRTASGEAQAQNSCPVEVVKGRLEITKVCEPTQVSVGGAIRFVVTVSNAGRGPLENVVVVDDYPDGISAESQNRASIGTLGPNESREVTFMGTATRPGSFTNVARATADRTPEVSATCTVTVVQCRLEMELVGPERIYVGDPASFSIVVRNVGDGAAEGCWVRVTPGGCLGGQPFDFQVGPLAPGQEFRRDFQATATSLGQCVVTADSSCGQQCQIRKEVGLAVTGLPALQVEMTDKALDGREEGTFRVGETFLYKLRIENDQGTEPTPDMLVALTLPPELEFVSARASMPDVTFSGSGTSATSSGFSLALAQALDFDIVVRVVSAPSGGMVRTEAAINLASNGTELMREVESTSLRP